MKQRRILLKTIILVALFLLVFTTTANAAGYKKAYRKIVKQFEKDNPAISSSYFSVKNKYSLIHIDKNKTPELVCEHAGYYIAVYTYKKGKAKCLTYRKDKWGEMFVWSFGAMGNYGYYYIPKKNTIFNRNANGAGAEYIDSFFTIKNGRFKFKKSIRYDMTKKGTRLPERKEYKPICGKYSKRIILKKLK